MKKKYLTDAISDEMIISLTGEMLIKENMVNNMQKSRIASALLKIMPLAAALVIGFINIFPVFFGSSGETENTEVYAETENIYANTELFLPPEIEKTFFETKILAAIKDKKDYEKINIYYSLTQIPGIFGTVEVYLVDPKASKREREFLLEIIRENTILTGGDMMQMLKDYRIPLPKNLDPAYSHVRFGDTENILLLEVEWHTYETYMEYIKKFPEEIENYKKSDDYLQRSDAVKNSIDISLEESLKTIQQEANKIREGKLFVSKFINGKNFNYNLDSDEISRCFDKDGYYIWNVYPYAKSINYWDEKTGEHQFKCFCEDDGIHFVYSKKEYDDFLKNEKIPFCDDLLEKGFMSRRDYDANTIKDPLEYTIRNFFD